MTKFFVPKPRGPPKGFAHPPKTKKSNVSCSKSLQKRVMQLLKKMLTRKIQKTIRIIREQKEQSSKQKLLAKLQGYKSISKPHLKQLSYYILLDELNVELSSLKKHFNIPTQQQQKELPQQVKTFYEEIKQKEVYRNEIEDAQRTKNHVNDKKKIKKEKAKLRKKTKFQLRKENVQQNGSDEINQVGQTSSKMVDQSQEYDQKESNDKQAKVFKEIQKGTIQTNITKAPKTEFKKTGRNKYLQEKRERRNRKFAPQKKTQQKQVRKQIPNRNETPHPSWQAKRQIKNQMFIQPFQGKRILL